MSPLAPAVLILERSPQWESELKRRLSGPRLLVRPCRSAADVLHLCRKIPGGVVVIDFAAGPADGLQLLEALARLRSGIMAIVIAPRSLAELEWPARELGAVEFIADAIGGAALARLCRRFVGDAAGVAGGF